MEGAIHQIQSTKDSFYWGSCTPYILAGRVKEGSPVRTIIF